MAKIKEVNLMMTKDQLIKAVEQASIVKQKYHEYWLFTEMLQEVNRELLRGQLDFTEGDKDA